MALHGDLQSFALPDVLRLLAGTGKTGRLAVEAEPGSGDVWLKAGQVVGGSVTSSPHAQSAADVVFELLRFDGGSFAFEDDAETNDAGDPTAVDDAINEAQGLLDEWKSVESVVPSVQSWIALRPELDGEQTTVTADQWRALAALGGGTSVRDLGNLFELTDLAVSRKVKDLVESGLVELGDPRDAAPSVATTPAPAAPAPDDLSVLAADDGPVVLETRDDALLPEPLPSESTSFEGELTDLSGSVDGRNDVQAEEALDAVTPPSVEVEPPSVDDAPTAAAAAEEPTASRGDAAQDGDSLGEADDAEEQAWTTFANGDTMVDHLADDAPDGGEPAESPAAAAADDGDRGSLLKFLSTVKN